MSELKQNPIMEAGRLIHGLRDEIGDERWFALRKAYSEAIAYAEERALQQGRTSLKLYPMTPPITEVVSR